MPQGKVTPPEIVAEVQARYDAGEPVRSIARDLGLSPSGATATILGQRRDAGTPERVSRVLLAAKAEELSQRWLGKGHLALDHITEDKLGKASAAALATVAGIATDKYLILSGQPTSRVEHTSQVPIERPGVLDALAELTRRALPGAGEVLDAEYHELPAPLHRMTQDGRSPAMDTPGRRLPKDLRRRQEAAAILDWMDSRTEPRIKAVIGMVAQGLTQKEIGAVMQVHQVRVSQIWRGTRKAWIASAGGNGDGNDPSAVVADGQGAANVEQ